MKATICVGISASGKTTWAQLDQQDADDINRDFIRFNVVCPGTDWSNYKFTNKREQDVTTIQEDMVLDAWKYGRDVIISDTNLNPKIRNKWQQFLTELGYEVEIKEFPITLEEAWKRDQLRSNGVGRDVIYTQYQKWLEYKGRKTYIPDESKPKTILFDIDGTLAQMEGRSPFDWDKVGTDSVKELIKAMADGYDQQGYFIICVSGRDSVCYYETQLWLERANIPYCCLFMREENDTRKDTIIKEEIFWDKIANNYNVVGVVDDRPSVLRMWHELKIPNVISVGNPWIEF